MNGDLHGWMLAHPPSAEATWEHDNRTWVSTGHELWCLDAIPRVWAVPDVDALVADGDSVLVASNGIRRRLDQPLPAGTCRPGLHHSAHWTTNGWCVEGLSLPYGARWASSLMPLAVGLGAVWTNEGQHFHCATTGVRAVRERYEGWWKRRDSLPQTWAVAQSGQHLWGPGGRLWDLETGKSHPVSGWTGGVATAHNTVAIVVNALTGDGVWYEQHSAVRRFSVPLRRDVAATLTWTEDGPILVTELGKQFALNDAVPRKLPGRMVPTEPDSVALPDVPIAVDAVVRVGKTQWAWRQDGLLLFRN